MEIDYFMIFVGLVPFAAALYLLMNNWIYSKYGYHTEGTVVEVIGKWHTNRGVSSYYYYPIIEFTTPSNEPKKLLMEIGSTFRMYSQGERVKIVYYQDSIYPNDKGWKISYVLLALVGLSVILYQFI